MRIELVAFRRIACLVSLLASGIAAAAGTDTGAAEPPSSAAVATIGKTPITYGDLSKAASQPLSQQEAEYDAHREQLRVQYERTRHETLDSELDKLIDKQVLGLEAKAEKTTPAALLDKLEKPAVTDQELHDLYDAHRNQLHESFDALRKRMTDFLLGEKTKKIQGQYYASLRAKYHVEVLLEPLRAAVSTRGPSRGPPGAAVTIVEFGDFQCPYCHMMEPVLVEALKRYPDSLRLVFKNYPLTDIHPQAMQAAQAAMCANQQGKFWPMHDALYAPGADLSIPSLRATAARVGLDSSKFEECVRDQEADGVIQEDMLEGRELAVNETPALFVNGRLIPGAVSFETLRGMIDEELRRKKSTLSAATALTGSR